MQPLKLQKLKLTKYPNSMKFKFNTNIFLIQQINHMGSNVSFGTV